MTNGVENQILAHLRRTGSGGAADIARRIRVSIEFARKAMGHLAEDGRIVKCGKAEYDLSDSEKRKPVGYARLEERRKPFVRW